MGDGRTEMDAGAVRLAVGGIKDVAEILGEIRKGLARAGEDLEAGWTGTAKGAYQLADAHTRAQLLRMQMQAGMLHGLVLQTCDDREALDRAAADAASGCGGSMRGGN